MIKKFGERGRGGGNPTTLTVSSGKWILTKKLNLINKNGGKGRGGGGGGH